MTKMAAMPIYGINPLKCFLLNHKVSDLQISILHEKFGPYKAGPNDDPALTLT